jgi:hypothetical protein
MKTSIKLLLLFLGLIGASSASAQNGIPTEGREFFLGMLYPSYNAQKIGVIKQTYNIYALITSQTDNLITVSYYDSSTKEETAFSSYTLAANKTLIVPLDTGMMKMRNLGEYIEYRSCHLVAKAPVSVVYYSAGENCGGSYLALPVQCWGKNYVVESYKDNPSGAGGYLTGENSSGYFLVIAASDSTSITITPNATTQRLQKKGVTCGKGATGDPQPFTISLHRGQSYMVKSQGIDGSCDISGSTVVSNKPVAVIGGHEDAYTDGSDIGTILVEARDFMIEQMIPVENWDSTGYFTVPFAAARGGQGGEGDNIAMFYGKLSNAPANYPKGTKVTLNNPGPISYDVTPYPSAVAIKSGVEFPTIAYDNNGAKMHIVQYDQRMQGSFDDPMPAPSQLSIIPRSGWKNNYQWYVPAADSQTVQAGYCTIICRMIDYSGDSILLTANGITKPLSKSDSLVRVFSINIAVATDLKGITLKIKPGTYFIKSIAKGPDNSGDVPFVVYQYGFTEKNINPSYPSYRSYANPTGMICKQSDISTPKLSAIVTESCGKWTICVTDSGSALNGIKYIELLNYRSSNSVLSIPFAHNVSLSASDDPRSSNEMILSGNDKQYCFDVFMKNLQDSAQLSLAVYDNSGQRLLVSSSTKPALTDIASSGSVQIKPDGDIAFTPTPVDTTLCGKIVLRRPAAKYTTDLVIDSLFFVHGNNGITFGSALPKFPVTIHPGDSLVLDVCFKTQNRHRSSDSIAIRIASCGSQYYLNLVGEVISGQLIAPDVAFGGVFRSDSICKIIKLTNTGSAPLQLKDITLTDTVNFTVSSPLFKFLPFTLDSGESIDVTVCFHPHNDSSYTAQVIWSTDISTSFIADSKLTSTLTGSGNAFDILWVPSQSIMTADSNSKPILIIKRYFLHNRTVQPVTIDAIRMHGPNQSEFIIEGSQKNTLTSFTIGATDSVWFDIAFVPDVSIPYPDRYADRRIDIAAVFRSSPNDTRIDSSILRIAGTFNSKYVFGVHQNEQTLCHLSAYTKDGYIIVTSDLVSDNTDYELYDILGRKVSQWRGNFIGNSSAALKLPPLPAGTYLLTATDTKAKGNCLIILK